ncbi:MAG: carbohydrate binding domain-containing protein [Anaerolineae bacterium]|nr:carbohydrate binding domain-containing protein [Anaerolineae bacterium]
MFEGQRKFRILTAMVLGVVALVTVTACARFSSRSPDRSAARAATLSPQATQRAATGTGQPLTLDFPRLGMWWPDLWAQPLTDIARYDWVILGDEPDYITPLRQLNPEILLLNSTNACEINYDPHPGAPLEANALAQTVPPEWFLTQVGSTLVAPVDEGTTVLSVAAVTATDGVAVYDLFVVSDTVLIDGEVVLVEDVDPSGNTLTVQRGYVRPATAHTAGARLAALITFWPGSWLMDLSTHCPATTFDPQVGPETWATANARLSADLVLSADWDGLLIDRSDEDESWLIGNSTARTIDPDRSNTLVTDYAAFDHAWNAGLRAYEADLRQRLGTDKILFVNWGMENLDLLNGNNFEGFPVSVERFPAYGVTFTRYWHDLVLGPPEDRGNYFEWMEGAQQPNLTMIETYEDDGGPDPSGDLAYENPYDDPDFVPDYRKMRLGLTTALLHDGFFSYEINTNGHGTLGLMWFDEYDNAGAGRGYLGQPLGPAFQVAPPLATPNMLGDSTFETSTGAWELWVDDGCRAGVTLDRATAAQGNASLRLVVSETNGIAWSVAAVVPAIPVISGTEYTLAFWARVDVAGTGRVTRTLQAWVQQASAPWDDLAWFGALPLSSEWQRYELPALANANDAAADFYFGLGAVTGTLWLDDVRLQAGTRDVWRRDYQGGVALVNATGRTQAVDLGGMFRKIQGTQAPAVNDGSTVDTVTLPPYDGIILLRPRSSVLYLPFVCRGEGSTRKSAGAYP